MTKNYASFKKLLNLEEGAKDTYGHYLSQIKDPSLRKDVIYVRNEEIEHVALVKEMFGILEKSKDLNGKPDKTEDTSRRLEERKKLTNAAVEILDSKLRLISLLEQMDEYNQKLKELNKLKSEFVSLAAHQIKSPLAAIRWLFDLLVKENKLTKNQKSYAKDIYSSNVKIANLIDDLLTISRMEEKGPKAKLEEIDLAAFCEDIIKKYQPTTKEKGLKIIFNKSKLGMKIKASSVLLSHIIDNLVSNAVKYTPAKGRITLVVNKKGNKISGFIADTGIGIPKESVSRIFERFYRAENAAVQNKEGTGLGLAIAKDSAKKLGGDIWFEPNRPLGTIFHFSFTVKSK